MKKNLILCYFTVLTLLSSCTKTESDFEEITNPQTTITLAASQSNVLTGTTVTFTLTTGSGNNVNNLSVFFVNGTAISGNTHTFTTSGTYTVKAEYQSITSNELQVIVTNPPTTTQFVNRVLVEEYSGTWCGNCPRILYATELLKQQTDKEVSVQIHLFGNDPFITTQGNQLASSLGINGVPAGRINRTINWIGPQYQNVNQVLAEIKPSSDAGLAINSTVVNGTINATITMGFANTTTSTKLMVYLVEDNLFHTQSNYSSNLYGGLSSIPNFKYDGVLRAIISPINGDTITPTALTSEKSYSLAIPNNVAALNQVKLVAFLIDTTTNAVINVREANINTNQNLEIL